MQIFRSFMTLTFLGVFTFAEKDKIYHRSDKEQNAADTPSFFGQDLYDKT